MRKLFRPYSRVPFDCYVKEGIDKEERRAYRTACRGLPFYAEHNYEQYCVLHFPGEKREVPGQFEEAIKRKLKERDYDFSGVHFPPGSTIPFQGIEFAFEARFLSTVFEGDATFSGTDFKRCVTFYRATFHRLADFRNATFENSAVFYETSFEGEARFSSSVFHGFAHFSLDRETRPLKSTFLKYADFRGTHFEKRAIFSGATFEGNVDFHDTCLSNATFENTIFQRSANFTRAEFNGTRRRTTDFRRATFGGELYFREAEFNGYTDFYRATFLDTVRFVGRESKNDEPSAMFPFRGRVSFMRARAEKPELVSFDSVKLRPSWFIGVDTRKFNFTAVEWHGWKSATARETEGALRAELSALDEQNVPQANERLARTCRELSMNYEENRDYAIAGHFHHWSMKAGQKSIWEGGFLAGAYGLLSGHGENPKLTLGLTRFRGPIRV